MVKDDVIRVASASTSIGESAPSARSTGAVSPAESGATSRARARVTESASANSADRSARRIAPGRAGERSRRGRDRSAGRGRARGTGDEGDIDRSRERRRERAQIAFESDRVSRQNAARAHSRLHTRASRPPFAFSPTLRGVRHYPSPALFDTATPHARACFRSSLSPRHGRPSARSPSSALLAASVGPVAAACPASARGHPEPYSSLKASTSLATIVASPLDADVKAKVNLGHQAVIDFIGGVEPVTAFLFEPNGAASAYADMETPMCTSWPARTGASDLVGIATGGGGNRRAPARGRAATRRSSRQRGSVLPESSDTAAGIAERAVHDTRTGQVTATCSRVAHGGRRVQMECLLAHKMPSPTGYAQCMKTAGGRGGVIPNMRGYFASAYGQSNGLAKGEDMCCNELCGTGDAEATFASGGVSNSGHLFYDSGAVAIAWAINKAGKTSKQFWTSKTSGVGFWGAIVPYDGYDYATGFPSSCPADAGWKTAFAAFPGHANIAAFYAEFDAKTATESDVLAILESDAAVEAQTTTAFDVATADSSRRGSRRRRRAAPPRPGGGRGGGRQRRGRRERGVARGEDRRRDPRDRGGDAVSEGDPGDGRVDRKGAAASGAQSVRTFIFMPETRREHRPRCCVVRPRPDHSSSRPSAVRARARRARLSGSLGVLASSPSFRASRRAMSCEPGSLGCHSVLAASLGWRSGGRFGAASTAEEVTEGMDPPGACI